MAWLFAGSVLAALYYQYNRARWAAEREHKKRKQELQTQLDQAKCYEDFKRIAHVMEALEESATEGSHHGGKDGGGKRSKGGKKSSFWGEGTRTYDKELIEEQLRLLRAQRASGNVEEMMFGLRADILRNLGNITNIGRKLHEPLWGVPRAVREYIDETRAQLRMIAQEHDIPLQEKLAFLQETRHCFGRTALLLSGGGTLGTFHVGVARALNARGCLPRVVAGSSVGSIVAAIMASRTPDELEEFFSEKHFWDLLPDMTFFSGQDFFQSITHLMRTGALHDIDFFQRCLRALLGDLTFQEAYDRSGGRILCVCVCATRAGEKPRLLNYLTSPHLVVWSAVAASCAFPSLFPPQPLLAKSRNGAFVPWQPEGKLGARRWRDGSLENDLPMQGLSELFNVNYFIVSQTNPHIVPILRIKRWFAGQGPACAMLASFLESEWRHRCNQILDLVPWMDAFDFVKLFGQQWEGNVTVVMAYSWEQFKKIATNPTREFLYSTATMGEREMWPKLATIESNCGIEMQLDECVRSLREKLSSRQGKSLKTRGRVPSWNTVNYCSRDSYLHIPQAGGGGSVASTLGGGGDGGGGGLGGLGGGGFGQADSVGGGSEGGRESSMSRTSSAGSLSEFVQLLAAEAGGKITPRSSEDSDGVGGGSGGAGVGVGGGACGGGGGGDCAPSGGRVG
jgi:TAG lipase/steryl ester hydrolase/phospholipase A2/LPA acyltransferase